MNEDNKALAANLKFEMDKLLRPKAVAASTKKRAAGSDFSSNRGSEERHATPITGRGQKRGRDNDIEKVCDEFSLSPIHASPSLPGYNGNILDTGSQGNQEILRCKCVKANSPQSAKELLTSESHNIRNCPYLSNL